MAIVLRVVYNLHSVKAEMLANMEKDADNPFAGLANLAVQSFQLDWGCPVLFVGACLLLVCAGWNKEAPASEANPPSDHLLQPATER